jgi:Zn-dependent protease
MSYQDRQYFRDDRSFGGYRGGASDIGQRILRVLNASFPIGTYLGIRVRVHIWFVIFAIFELVSSSDLLWTLQWMALLFMSVLLHEFGHCLACRRVGGEANEILMWPLGGLAYCSPPHRPWPEFVTVVWGPLVNVILAAASYIAMWIWFRDATPLRLNPFNPYVYFPRDPMAVLIVASFVVNYALLLFNVLMIFYPFDGGRLVQIALWTRLGYVRSMRLATSFGMAGAIVTGLVALALNKSMLLVIAIFGFITCVQQARYVRQAGDFDFDSDVHQRSYETVQRPGFFQRWRQSRARKAAERQVEKQREAEQQIDKVLDKVHREGLASLSDRERAVLQRASRRSS